MRVGSTQFKKSFSADCANTMQPFNEDAMLVFGAHRLYRQTPVPSDAETSFQP